MTELAAAPLRTRDSRASEGCDNILYSDTSPADATRLMERVHYYYAITERYRQLVRCFFYAQGLTEDRNDPPPKTNPKLNRRLINFLEQEGQIPVTINCYYYSTARTEAVTGLLRRNVEMYTSHHMRRDVARIYNQHGRLNAYAISYHQMDQQGSFARDRKGYCGICLDEQGRVLARAKSNEDYAIDAMLMEALTELQRTKK